MEHVLEKLIVSQVVRKFLPFYANQPFITAFIRTRHLFLSWARWIQSNFPIHISRWSLLLLFSHLRMGLPSSLFPSDFTTKTLQVPLLSAIHALCPAHLMSLDLIPEIMFRVKYRSRCSLLRSPFQSPIISSLLRPLSSSAHRMLRSLSTFNCTNLWFTIPL